MVTSTSMYCRILLCFICLNIVFTSKVYSQGFEQQLGKLKDIIPPSPDAASLGKYGEWPVGLYTGIPQISIPIYEIKGRSLSIPISISYHASGIKVGEIASQIGLGWSLQAGSTLSRSVRGLPDELPGAGYLDVRKQFPNPYDLSDPASGTLPNQAVMELVCLGIKDSEPDLYYLNVMGKSYEFFFSVNDVVVTQPYSNIKILPDFTNKKFTVILEDGTKLYFGGTGFIETTSNPGLNSFVPTANNFVSTWCLNKIVTPKAETFLFTYTSQTANYDYSFSEVDYNLVAFGTIAECYAPDTYPYAQRMNSQIIYGLKLASIESDLVKVNFIPETTERLDLTGNYALSKIRVFSKLENKDIYEFNFVHSFSSAASGLGPDGKSTGQYAKRLKLDYLQQFKPNTTIKLNEWNFIYNSQLLPARACYAQDHWGYYNGAPNLTLLPKEPGFLLPSHTSGNREINSDFTQAESLTKIIYPTKGYTIFNYENNSYQTKADVYKDSVISNHWDLNYNANDNVLVRDIIFNIHKPQNVTLSVSAVYSQIYRNNHQAFMPTVTIIPPAVGNTLTTFPAIKEGGIAEAYCNVLGDYILRISRTVTNFNPNDPNDSWINTSLQFSNFKGNQNTTIQVGGLRLLSMEDNDPVGNSPTVKRYFKYENALVVNPIDINKDYVTLRRERGSKGEIMTQNGNRPCFNDFDARNSQTLSALGSIQGGVIGYGKVTTLYGQNGENGKVISRFSNDPNLNTDLARIFPFPPATNLDSRRGLLVSESTLDSNNKLIRKDSTIYSFFQKNKLRTFKAGINKHVYTENSQDLLYNLENYIHFEYFDIISEQIIKNSNIQTSYDASGLNSLSTTTTYHYDNPANLLPVRTKIINSKGDTLKTYSRTPLEKAAIQTATPLSASASLAIDSMLRNNIINSVIQSEQYNGANLLVRNTINYKIGTSNIVSPESIKSQTANNAAETRILFKNYDSKGNLLEQSKTNDVNAAYLYDYSVNYPIAEVKNASYTDIAYTSFESDGNGNWTIPSNRNIVTFKTGNKSYDMSSGNITKSGLSSLKTYVISFWAKSSAVTVNGVAATPGDVRNGWTYYEILIMNVSLVTIAGTATIDDLRLYPREAEMTSYTYSPGIGVTSITDSKNITLYYEYDDFGRLSLVRDDRNKILKQYQYNFKK